MTKYKQEIIDHIKNQFRNVSYMNCYIGITSNVESHLLSDHNVSRENGHWIYRATSSENVARQIEQYFLDRGMDGALMVEMKIQELFMRTKNFYN